MPSSPDELPPETWILKFHDVKSLPKAAFSPYIFTQPAIFLGWLLLSQNTVWSGLDCKMGIENTKGQQTGSAGCVGVWHQWNLKAWTLLWLICKTLCEFSCVWFPRYFFKTLKKSYSKCAHTYSYSNMNVCSIDKSIINCLNWQKMQCI